MNAPDQKPPLEYDRTGTGPTRRQFRLLLILTAVNTLFLGWFVAGPQTGQIFKNQWQQWQARRAKKERVRKLLAVQEKCLHYSFPAGLVVYEEDPVEAKKLLTTRADYGSVSLNNTYVPGNWTPAALREKTPTEWNDFVAVAGTFGQPWERVIFFGERRTPGGEPRLVVIHLWPQSSLNPGVENQRSVVHSQPSRFLTARMIKPSIQGEQPNLVRSTFLRIQTPPTRGIQESSGEWRLGPASLVRLFAGQADSADASKVILPYQLNGESGEIEVYLLDDGPVFKPKTGDLSFEGDGIPVVELTPGPTTRP
jgi:hypothetical protein